MEHYTVIICGGGPVGLLIALRLGQANIKTLVLERHNEVLPTTRAMVYQPVVLEILAKLGIRERIEQEAHLNREGIYWRDIDGNELGHLSMVEGDHVLLFGQYRMGTLILDEIDKYPSVKVRFGVSYAGCEQGEPGQNVKVMAHEPASNDDIIYTTDWLVGTDGANSAVRRSLCIPFEGFSFTEFNMIGADICYDFAAEEYGTVMNFIVHPEDWAVVIYTGQQKDMKPKGQAPPLWRIAYVEPTGFSMKPEDILKRAKERCSRYTKDKKDLEITRAEPYRLHQRCAARAIKGRVVLAGDALHSNNPIGGLGLTTGICDAYAMGNALVRVCTGHAPDSLVAEAANDRRETWLNVTNKLSQVNLERLRSDETKDIDERLTFLDTLKTDQEMPRKIRAMFQKIAGKDFGESQQIPIRQTAATPR